MQPPAPVPIEAYLRRSDWQLAVLVVALVVAPGVVDDIDVGHRGHAPVVGAHAPRRPRTTKGRAVRPPRSC